jgi:hypothetical protein
MTAHAMWRSRRKRRKPSQEEERREELLQDGLARILHPPFLLLRFW